MRRWQITCSPATSHLQPLIAIFTGLLQPILPERLQRTSLDRHPRPGQRHQQRAAVARRRDADCGKRRRACAWLLMPAIWSERRDSSPPPVPQIVDYSIISMVGLHNPRLMTAGVGYPPGVLQTAVCVMTPETAATGKLCHLGTSVACDRCPGRAHWPGHFAKARRGGKFPTHARGDPRVW